MEDFIGKYNGGQIESRLDKVKDMVGATASGAGATPTTPTHRLTTCRWCCLAVTRTTGRMRASLAWVRIVRLPLRLVASVRAFAFSPNFVKRRRSRTSHVGNFFV